ncbi:MAG: 8-amino-7-oxononanoate synthase [Opitutaceae bacterium]|nr:8-amino-7-oxononanoate synthase [Cytophagales bacterium]
MHTDISKIRWQDALNKRNQEKSLRELKITNVLTDFSSNDYLGLARNTELHNSVKVVYDEATLKNKLGSTGSRLITGNNKYFEQIESYLAQVHQSEAALLFNSGYVANLGVFSTLPQRGDTILFDELSHACIKDGIRLSQADRFPFLHNNLESLEKKIKKAKGQVYIAVESVYSMDGDFAPLKELAALSNKYNAILIVDEAHSTGIFGKNGSGLVCELSLEDQIPIRIHTFGKAMGCHGAVVVGSQVLKDYLVNFARPFIFTTAMSLHSVLSIHEAYKFISQNHHLQCDIKNRVHKFNNLNSSSLSKAISHSPIQIIIIPGNEEVRKSAILLQNNGFDIRPILSPTVKKGSERLRICLHTFNSDEEIDKLCKSLMLTSSLA